VTPPPAAAAAPVVRPRQPISPRRPRRVSGPGRPAQRVSPRRRRETGFALGAVSALEALAQHRMLDRLIRGRTWIGIVAFALIGIVTLQLGLLKLNGGIGRALEREAVLQRENAALSIENSDLAAGPRVQARAGQLGMAFVATSALHFLSAPARADVVKAATALSAATHTASAEASEAAATGGEPGESPSSTESAQASAGSPETSQAEAASGQGAEAGAGESESAASESAASESAASESAASESAGSEPAGSEASATGGGEAEHASGAGGETGAGGGAAPPGG
jgi:hypothetical protein